MKETYTKKVDHFTAFESFPSTGCCSVLTEVPANSANKIENFGWLDM